MAQTGREIHAEVEQLRESGDLEGSIKLSDDAIKAYKSENNMLGLSDLYGTIALAYRLLFQVTDDRQDLVEAKTAALEGVRIAKENNLKGDLARPLFNLAKVQEDLGNLQEALETYKQSLDIFQTQNPTLHNRAGVLADMKVHISLCEYKLGDKSALERLQAAITELMNSDEEKVSKYNYDVWLSGAYMNMAELLRTDNPALAREYFMKAKSIIDANPTLKIRKEQWEKMAKNF